jgi:uncharacterized delta-60 repeat protein
MNQITAYVTRRIIPILACGIISGHGQVPAVDPEFDPGTGVSGAYVHCLQSQTDGKIIIGGNFSATSGLRRNHLARLLSNGTPDDAFDPGSGPSSEILALAVQPDGKILVGGDFTSYNRIPRHRIARLNADGSLDTSFNPEPGPNAQVRSILVKPDGQILVGGWFARWGQTNRNGVALLNADGTLDPNFNVGSGPMGGYVFTLLLQSDGKVFVSGEFTRFAGETRGSIVRLNADGSVDLAFNPGKGVDGWIGSMLLQPDDKLVILGDFNKFQDTARSRVARLQSDGSLDLTFNPGKGFAGDSPSSLAIMMTAARQKDGKIVAGGIFSKTDTNAIKYLARLNPDGSVDTEFNPRLSDAVRAIGLLSDGRMIIGGAFKSCGGKKRSNIARLQAFPPPTGSLKNAKFNASQEFGFTIRGEENGRYRVESSNDLIEWQPQSELNLEGTATGYTDAITTNCNCRFYRLVRMEY